MTSALTLRHDTARTGTTPNFPFDGNPWRKYVSMNLSASMRAGVLVVENWLFKSGPYAGKTYTLVLAAASDNTVSCFSEGQLLAHGSAATPLWTRSLGVNPRMDGWGTPGAGGHYSNIPEPIGVIGTPVVDAANRRMFVMACWTANPDPSAHDGHYTIFELALDDGSILNSAELVHPGVQEFDPQSVDQRTALNHVNGWLWIGFADIQNDDDGKYYGWVVAIKDDLSDQLYQPMISLTSTNKWNMYGAGVWGPGGVAAAPDGSVYALTGNATQVPGDYWTPNPVVPGERNDYFEALVHLEIDTSGATPELNVIDWFQESDSTQNENSGDWDFGGSSPVVLPPIDGQNLIAFVPKDGDIFVLDSKPLGNWTAPLLREPFAQAVTNNGDDTKVAIAFVQTPDGKNILVVGADSNGATLGGVAAFELDASVNPPTLSQLWKSPHLLNDSFGSPTVIGNPVPDPANPPDPFALAWVVDAANDDGDQYMSQVAVRAYEVESGHIAYDSTTNTDVTERIPHFAPITAGANSVFIATENGFIGFTQFAPVTPALSFIVDRSTFGKDEIDGLEGTAGKVTIPAFWVELSGVLPDDIGVTPSHLTPNQSPNIAMDLSALPAARQTAIKNMMNPGKFTGVVTAEAIGVPDEPQAFLFPYSIAFTGDGGFGSTATLVPLSAQLTLGGPPLSAATQLELVAGADPFFLDVNPSDPTQPTWLSFDLRLFQAIEGSGTYFGEPAPTHRSGVYTFMQNVMARLKSGNTGGETFDPANPSEATEALEWKQKNNEMHNVYNFAVARVRLTGETVGRTPYPVRVFFRLFQAQNTTSSFNTATTYRETVGSDPIALLGVQNGEYVTIPCFATQRFPLLNPPQGMAAQTDPPNVQYMTITTSGETVEAYFGCCIDNNQPDQMFLPKVPPPSGAGGLDGPWTAAAGPFGSVFSSITTAPHQCLVAEINYPGAPPIPGATTGTSDKLGQRNIGWIDGPNPGQVESRRMPHPVQVWPTPRRVLHPDELMIFWGETPPASEAQLYLPAVDAAAMTDLANRLRSWQHTWMVDAHTVGVGCDGVTFLPLPNGIAPLAGLMTVTLPPGIHKDESYRITVRQLTDELTALVPPRGRAAEPVTERSRRVAGAFQLGLQISTKERLLIGEERQLALLRYLADEMAPTKRWYPVMQRYIDYTAGRVRGFGGDPTTILPSPIGWVPGLPKPAYGGHDHIEGKIDGLVFDHFGDFMGFVLEAEDGSHHDFDSREPGIEKLARHAQHEHLRVRVIPQPHHADRVHRLIVL